MTRICNSSVLPTVYEYNIVIIYIIICYILQSLVTRVVWQKFNHGTTLKKSKIGVSKSTDLHIFAKLLTQHLHLNEVNTKEELTLHRRLSRRHEMMLLRGLMVSCGPSQVIPVHFHRGGFIIRVGLELNNLFKDHSPCL